MKELSVIEISKFSLILFYPTTQVRLLLSPFHAYLSYLFNSHLQLSKFKVSLQSLPYLTILQNLTITSFLMYSVHLTFRMLYLCSFILLIMSSKSGFH